MKTRLVPIPAPAILEERIRQVMDDEKMWNAALSAGAIDKDGKVTDQSKLPEKFKQARKANPDRIHI